MANQQQQQQQQGGNGDLDPSDDGKLLNLAPKISNKDCYAKNVDNRFPMSNLFIGDTRLGCKSDADEQLILHVAFNEFVKVSVMCHLTWQFLFLLWVVML